MHGRIPDRFRLVAVSEAGAGMRLDRYLAARFSGRTRSELARGIRQGLVTDVEGKALRASATVRTGQELRLYLPGIAPGSDAPSFPPILYEDDRVVVIDKPPDLSSHPAGTSFEWAVVGLARARWPDHDHVDLAHRLDRDTSGALVLTKDAAANAFLKAAFKHGEADKEYLAFVRGHVEWDHTVVDAPIGTADGPIRIQRAVRDDGLPARTEVWVEERTAVPGPPMTRVRVRLYTGRTHQIRVHLAHVARGLVGDRMYGVPPDVFLRYWELGDADDAVIEGAGAPRHALHAARVAFPHPDGGTIEVRAPLAPDLARWWADPTVLPFDRPR